MDRAGHAQRPRAGTSPKQPRDFMSTKIDKPTWEFAARFRRHAFGWKSQPAITRIREAVSEIKVVARKDPLRGAEGAVMFLVRLSPAIERVDSSSGSIGNAVNRAIDALAPLITNAPVDPAMRRKWLETLFEAHGTEAIPYIEPLGDHWGDLCASPTLAAEWADALAPTIETTWRQYPQEHGYFHGTNMGLSAMLAAGQYDRLLALLGQAPYTLWHDHHWGVKALVALGRTDEALQYAEALRDRSAPSGEVARTCEAILLACGRIDEAYTRYAIEANHASTYLATFRALCKKYPHKAPEEVLRDLVDRSPGEEGKWFAAAKDAGLYGLASGLARRTPVDHRTLIRAARDFSEHEPGFAADCALLALYWICAGRALEVSTGEILAAFDHLREAASQAQCLDPALSQLQQMLDALPAENIVRRQLYGKLACRIRG